MNHLILGLVLIGNFSFANGWEHSKENEWVPMDIDWDQLGDDFYTAAENQAKDLENSIFPREEYKFYYKGIIINSEKVIALRASCKSRDFQNGAAADGGGACYFLGVYLPKTNRIREIRFSAPYQFT